jgi:cytochrome c553
MKIILVLFITLFSFFSTFSYADTQAESGSVAATVASNLTDEIKIGKEKAQTICSACHGLDGVAASGGNSVIIPNLTAQHKDYLIAKLQDYKTNRLAHPQMSIIAQMLTDEEIVAVSEWYSRIKITIFDPNLILAKPSK